MRLSAFLSVALLIACAPVDRLDGGYDAATIDAGARCGPLPASGTGPECVSETCFGGLQCVNGPCPYPCCLEGMLTSCEIPNGYECNVVAAVNCGGGTCVQAPDTCP